MEKAIPRRQKKKKGYFKTMYALTKGHRFMFYFGFFLQFFAVSFILLSTLLNKVLVDTLTNSPPTGPIDRFLTNVLGGQEFLRANLWVFAIIILGFGVGRSLINVARNIMRGALESSIMREMQLKLFYHLERLPYPEIKKMKNGDIIQTATRDEEILRAFIIRQLNMMTYTIEMVIFSFLILSTISLKIALSTIIILPIMAIYSFFTIRKVRKLYRITDDSEGLMTAKIEENLNAVRVVKAFNNETYEIDDFEKYLTDYEGKFLKWRKFAAFYYASSDIFIFGQIALSLIFGVYLGLTGEISPGTLVVAVSYTGMIVWPVRQFAQILSNLARAVVSVDRIRLILGIPIEDIDSGETPEIHGHIVFKDAKFHYEDDDEAVIHDFNLDISPGETIAIMGKTGSGKSTLAHILSRLYEYTEGSITIDGVELKNIQKKHLRSHIATVLQEPFLFSRTILNNLKIANKKATENEIIRATSIADIHQTIVGFEKGYDTPVGEKGVTLSGGQKQRLAIARTIINEVPILIFDDSLSAVDTETDINIRSALKKRAQNTTTLIITHRVSTAKDANRIIVLEDGRISQIGNHDELINQDGLYRRIYDIQTRII
ncbi:MAG: ABC transporter ATP-binding protein [Bacilli bacterium]|jgi:ATP-binding cassette subfamily B protein|nr:ABC transporter ATP-binding protein [Bacilli bacterium]MDD3389160.1 ABC transporter ATP-binding protein [Bacilli bacterium]MDD4344804.1 ABC transporter ATP-binding protein [Bacilli bacterium]MDD4520872.1 ABC transporter ATP-binding protein [Bacilli bacterium]